MNKMQRKFPEAAQQRIVDAIHRAERDTSAEIVVAAAAESGRYDRAEDVTGLVFAVIGITKLWLFLPQHFHIAAVSIILVVGFYAGIGFAMICPPWRRLLTRRTEMLNETHRAAEALFYKSEIQRTGSRCGVLLYISFFERTASVIADTTVLEKLGQEGIDRLCYKLTTLLRDGDATTAVERIVEETGRQLAAVLPAQQGDAEELPNHFLLLG